MASLESRVDILTERVEELEAKVADLSYHVARALQALPDIAERIDSMDARDEARSVRLDALMDEVERRRRQE